MFVWPAARDLDTQEKAFLNLFLANVAGDATTNLYKMFVDSKSKGNGNWRAGSFRFPDDEMVVGNPVYMGLTDVIPANMTEQKIAEVRQKILDEMQSHRLVQRWLAGIGRVQRTTQESDYSEPPRTFKVCEFAAGLRLPLFGCGLDVTPHRSQSDQRLPQVCNDEAGAGGDRKTPQRQRKRLAHVCGEVETRRCAALCRSGQTGAATRRARRAGAKQLERKASSSDSRRSTASATTPRHCAVLKSNTTRRLPNSNVRRSKQPSLRFVENPPLTLDDQLDFKVSTFPSGVPMVASTFENMTSATAGIALRLDGLPEDQLVYLSMLPALLTQAGVIKDGKPISFEEMSEMQRKEILALNSYFTTNFKTNRAELAVRGSGTTWVNHNGPLNG